MICFVYYYFIKIYKCHYIFNSFLFTGISEGSVAILRLMSQILWAFERGDLFYRENEVVAANEEAVTLASQFRRYHNMGWLAHSGQLTNVGAVAPPIITLAGFRVCLLSPHSLHAPSLDYSLVFLTKLDDILRRYEDFLHMMSF